jgi:hypothetical protein
VKLSQNSNIYTKVWEKIGEEYENKHWEQPIRDPKPATTVSLRNQSQMQIHKPPLQTYEISISRHRAQNPCFKQLFWWSFREEFKTAKLVNLRLWFIGLW